VLLMLLSNHRDVGTPIGPNCGVVLLVVLEWFQYLANECGSGGLLACIMEYQLFQSSE